MTPAELRSLLENIVTQVNSAATFAEALAPQYAAFIAIGKAVDSQVPGLVEAVDNWIHGEPPTDLEKAELADKLKVLGDPNAP